MMSATTGEGVTRGVSPQPILDKVTTLRRDPNMEPSDPRVRIAVLVGALKLEVLGMKRRGRSVYAIVKDEFGLRGNKKRVLEQLQDIKARLNEPYPEPPALNLKEDPEVEPSDEYNGDIK